VATDPYRNWSGAPKHWVDIPAQRHCPPAPEQLDVIARHLGVGDDTGSGAEWSVAAVALAVAVAAFVLIGTGSAVTDGEGPPAQRTNGTSTR